MMGKPTEEELELLTDEEREALEFDENATDGDELDELDEEAEGEPDDEGEEGPEGDQEEEKPGEDDKPADEPVVEPPAEDVADKIPEVVFRPKPVELTANVKAHIEAEADKVNADLKAKLAELKEKYDDGEIDTVEYFDQASTLKEEISANKADIRDTVRAQFMEQETARQRWEAEQDAFFKMNAEYDAPIYDKSNKLVSGNPILYGALDAACQKISRENPGVSGIDLLIKAKAEVDTLMGRKVDKPGGRPSAPRPGRNVGDLPSTAPESTAGEFSHLDKLSGDALEDALDKLPAEKRDRYLAGA